MKNIQRKRKGFQKSDETNEMIARINRLREAFSQIEPGNQEKFIDLLSAEIETVDDESIQHWLIRFRSILITINESAAASASA